MVTRTSLERSADFLGSIPYNLNSTRPSVMCRYRKVNITGGFNGGACRSLCWNTTIIGTHLLVLCDFIWKSYNFIHRCSYTLWCKNVINIWKTGVESANIAHHWGCWEALHRRSSRIATVSVVVNYVWSLRHTLSTYQQCGMKGAPAQLFAHVTPFVRSCLVC